MGERERTSPWVWVGVGCGGLLLLAMVFVGGLVFWGVRAVGNVREEMRNPDIRAARVKAALGCRELPAGYHPLFSFSVPFLLDVAVLSDRPLDRSSEASPFLERGFVYVRTLRGGRDEKRLRDFVEGRAEASDLLGPARLDLETGETIRRGSFERDDMTLRYAAHRGSLRIRRASGVVRDPHTDSGTQRVEGLVSLLLMDCRDDPRLRLGVWFGLDPSPDRPPPEVDYSGTPADETAIREFTSHFSPCGEKPTER